MAYEPERSTQDPGQERAHCGPQPDNPVPVYVPAAPTQGPDPTPTPVYVPAAGARPRSEPVITGRRWNIWLLWVGLALAGAVVGVTLNSIVSRVVFPPGWGAIILFEGIFGAALGLGQWLALRQVLPSVPWWVWVAVTVVGQIVGTILVNGLFPTAGYIGMLGCITGGLIPLLMGPLYFVTKRIEEKPVIGYIVTIVLGMIAFVLDKTVSPAVEDTVASDTGLAFITSTVGNVYLTATFLGLAQWLALRRYIRVAWAQWVLAALVGGAFAGLFRAILIMVLGVRFRYSFVGDLVQSGLTAAVVAAVTGFVLLKSVLPAPEARTPLAEPAGT